jgi:hypothetical protein
MTAPMPPVASAAPKIQVDAETEPPSTRPSSLSRTFDLSSSRTYDSALDILGAYKLTGNFHINLEIVLKHLGAFDEVRYEIEAETLLPFRSDRRRVVFWPNEDISTDRFSEIMRSLTSRIGFDARLPWWSGQLSKVAHVLAFVIVRTRAAVANSWQAAMADQVDKYRPEAHYMRGPGPKWRAKYARVFIRQ